MNKCKEHWYYSKDDLDKHGDCPYYHDENGEVINPYEKYGYTATIKVTRIYAIEFKSPSYEQAMEDIKTLTKDIDFNREDYKEEKSEVLKLVDPAGINRTLNNKKTNGRGKCL